MTGGKRSVLIGTALGAVLSAGAAYFLAVFVAGERRAAEERWAALLSAMADDRAAAIERWVDDLVDKAHGVAAYPTVRYLLGGGSEGPLPFPAEQGPRAHIAELLASRVDAEALVAGYLVAADGALLAASDGSPAADAMLAAAARATLAVGDPAIDVYRAAGGELRVVASVPVPARGGGAPAGAVLLCEDPDAWLYRFLRAGAGTTSSAETVLARREGDRVRYLVPLRHGTAPPLSLTRPVATPGLADLVAFGGAAVVGHYADYRGVPVLAAARRIAGTPWGLVVKVDEAEASAEVNRRLRATGAAATGFLLALVVGLTAFWRAQRAAEALAVARAGARFAALVDQANDAILSLGPDGSILDANRRAEELYGLSRERLRALTVIDLRPQEAREHAARHLAAALASGSVVFETVQVRSDGTTFPAEVSARRVSGDGGATLLSIVRDVSERAAASARIARLNRFVRTRSEIDQLIVRERQPERLLAEACRIIVEHGELAMAWIGRVDARAGAVRPIARAGAWEGYLDTVEVRCDDTPAGRGPTGIAAREGRTLVVADWEADARVAPWRAAAARQGFRSSAAVPIREAEQVTAVLSVYGRLAGELDDEIMVLLEELAADLAYALAAIEARRVRAAAVDVLAESEERLRFALETGQMGGWDLDLVDHTAHRTLGHDRIFGYRELLPEWTYELFLEHVLPEDRAGVDRKFMAATTHGTDWSFECRIRRVDGAVRWIWAAGRHQVDAAGRTRRMAGIVQDVTERKRGEERLRQLAARVAESEEAERRRIARGLHDQVGQNLVALNLNLALVKAHLPREAPPDAARRIDDASALVAATSREIRAVIADLHPAVLADFGLVTALRELAAELSASSGADIEVEGDDLDPRPASAVEAALYRVAQEALTNCLRHARATRVRVAVEASPAAVALRVADDGCGFDPAATAGGGSRRTFGLGSMRERAEAAGGRWEIASAPGRGTTVTVEVPR